MNTFDLKLFRKTNHLTQLALAEYLGVTKSFICQIENGRVDLPYEKKEMIINNERGWVIPILPDDGVVKYRREIATRMLPVTSQMHILNPKNGARTMISKDVAVKLAVEYADALIEYLNQN